MTPNIPSSKTFHRTKLLLFKFLAHQIHPFAYAVNTFLQPALDDCRKSLHDSPEDTFNILLSISQTFIRFAPDSALIYDDIQQFASKLRDNIDECFIWLDTNTIQQSSQIIESINQGLLNIIQQESDKNKTIYTNLYKNMSAVLANLQKISSLPVEMENLLLNDSIDTTVPIDTTNSKDIEINTQGYLDSHTTTVKPSSYDVPLTQNEIRSTSHAPSATNPLEPSSIASFPSLQNNVISSMATSITNKLMNQMKNLTVSTEPQPPTDNLILSSAINQTASRPMSTISYGSDYEISGSLGSTDKNPGENITSFPLRHDLSMTTTNGIRQSCLSSDDYHFGSQSNTHGNHEKCNTPASIFLNDDALHFGTTPTTQTKSNTPFINYDELDEEASRQYYLNPCFSDPVVASAQWHPTKAYLSVVIEQSHMNFTTKISHSHVTDEYIQEFGTRRNRPNLRGELSMTYGTPQSGPQSTCLPIGVGLSYDELTLLSCDVHRNSQNVRLFDIDTGKLKHTISSNQQMKLHRPSAVMSNARNNIMIVERDYIYVTEPDGRLIQSIGHRSIKQLYGVALLHDRYILTIDSKSNDSQTAENSRLLLFDPNSGQLVFEQYLGINRETEDTLKTRDIINHIQGKVLPETSSKPRFLAVHNDNIYIADLGRSLIYGTTIGNRFDFHFTTVFGGQGRAHGEMTDPSGLFIDSGGNIISADSKNDRIQIFTSNGEYKTTLKFNERIKRPSGICTNRAGTQFYVSCYLAGCVRAFNINY